MNVVRGDIFLLKHQRSISLQFIYDNGITHKNRKQKSITIAMLIKHNKTQSVYI